MSRTLLLITFVTLALSQDRQDGNSGSKPAQQDSPLIVPAFAKERAGGSNNNIPFSWTPTRWQQGFAPEVFEFEGTLLIGGVSFRRDPRQTTAAGTVELEVALATLPGGLETMSATFDENVRNRQVVMPRQKIEVKKAEELEETPKNPLEVWDLQLRFARPYKYRTDRALVLEVTVFGNDQGDAFFLFPLDAVQDDKLMRRVYAERGKTEGTTDGPGLVVRFDLAARAAAPASRPATPESRPASLPTSRRS